MNNRNALFLKLLNKWKKGNIVESVFDNIEESVKYNVNPYKLKHRQIIGMKRRLQYYKRLKKEIYDNINLSITLDNSEYNKIVWFCWLQGIEQAPDIVKVCYDSIKKQISNHDGWKVILLTEKNISQYITVPNLIEEKYKKGIITKTAYSDIIRLELLIKYGGIWTDATVLWTGTDILLAIEKSELFFPDKWTFFSGEIMKYDNWLISSKSNNRYLIILRECLYKYWEKYNYQMDYFIFHIFLSIIFEDYKDEHAFTNMPFLSVHICEKLQMLFYEKLDPVVLHSILLSTDIHKLNYKAIPETNIVGTYYEWILSL